MSNDKPIGVAKRDIKAGETITFLVGVESIESPDIELTDYGRLFVGKMIFDYLGKMLDEELKNI
jgi:hypothetical protein